MKKYVENFYYGVLFSLFIYFMEHWQTGKVGYFYMTCCLLTPFITSWYFTKFLHKE